MSRLLGKLGDAFERLLSRPTTAGPLYVSNRTRVQRLRTTALVVGPFLAVALGIVIVQMFPPQTTAPKTLTNVELANKIYPDVSKVPVETNHDVDVANFGLENTAGRPFLAGIARNQTNHQIAAVEILFQLVNENGSVLGTVTVGVHNLPANGTAPFRVPVPFKEAVVALVRDVQSQ